MRTRLALSKWPRQRLLVQPLRTFIEKTDNKTPPITIVAGIRRVGKSTILKQLQEIFPNSLYINFRDNTWIPGDYAPDAADAVDVLDSFMNSNQITLLLLDEITSLEGYEERSRELYDNAGKNGAWAYKVIITGSSPAHLFKLAHLTLGGGRSKAVNLPVLSFVEYMYFTGRIKSYDKYEHVTIQDFKDYLVLKNLDPELAVSFDEQYFVSYYEENYSSNNNRRAGRAYSALNSSDLLDMANLLAYQLSEHATYRTTMSPSIGEKELKQLAVNSKDLQAMSLSLSSAILAQSVRNISPVKPSERARLIRFLVESRLVNCSTSLLNSTERKMDAAEILTELESTTSTEHIATLFNKVSISMCSPLLYTRLGDDILGHFGLDIEYILSDNANNALLGKMLEVYLRGAITQHHCAILPYTTAKINYPNIGEVDIWDEKCRILCEVTAGADKKLSKVHVTKYFSDTPLLRVCATQESQDEKHGFYRIPYPVLCCMIDTGDLFKLSSVYGLG